MKNYLTTRHFYIVTFFSLLFFTTGTFAQLLPDSSDRFLGASNGSSVYRNFYRYWNQVTPGNAGKWGSVENVRGTYNWTILDTIYNYAQKYNIMFKEHVLVWGSQEPSWVASLDSASQREAVENWMKAVGERYPNMVLCDVVNEAFHVTPSYKNALGGDGETGWDWIITAFELARKYMPSGAKLLLNEYSVLHDDNVTTNYLAIINLLKERNLIDGIAVQGHYFEFRSDLSSSSSYVYSTTAIKNNLKRLTDTGIPVYISEFDIDEPDDTNQLEQYQIYFPILWNNPGVAGITFWGYYQDDVWNSHPDTYLIKSDGRGRPALDWLKTYIYLPLIPEQVSPVTAGGVQRNTIFVWKSSKTADSYTLQVSTTNRFSSFVVDTTVTDTIFQVDSLSAGTRYYWRVCASNSYGQGDFSAAASFTTGSSVVSVDEENYSPYEFDLAQNYPNPFNPSTFISYSVPNACEVSLKVYDVLGKEVSILVDAVQQQGEYIVKFNAGMLPSGVYFYKLQAGNNVAVKKFMLLK